MLVGCSRIADSSPLLASARSAARPAFRMVKGHDDHRQHQHRLDSGNGSAIPQGFRIRPTCQGVDLNYGNADVAFNNSLQLDGREPCPQCGLCGNVHACAARTQCGQGPISKRSDRLGIAIFIYQEYQSIGRGYLGELHRLAGLGRCGWRNNRRVCSGPSGPSTLPTVSSRVYTG